MKLSTCLLALLLCLSSHVYAGERSGISLQIIMDDSGVLIQSSMADRYKLLILSHLKALGRKRKYARAHINVISTSLGRSIWSGTPSDLKRKPERAQALVKAIKTNKENCNNLPGAFAELKSNIRAIEREGASTIYVIVFSSLIHTPRPCDSTTQIVLPQEPPVRWDFNGALTSSALITSIRFYWVSPHQKNVWEEFLKPSFDWMYAQHKSITLMDIERSKFVLEHGLALEVSP